MTAAQAMQVATNPGFRDRIRYHMAVASVEVMAEAANVTGHTLRVAYANSVLNGSADFGAAAVAIMTNATLKAKTFDAQAGDLGIPESDLPFVANTLFNALAGVSL